MRMLFTLDPVKQAVRVVDMSYVLREQELHEANAKSCSRGPIAVSDPQPF